MHKIASDKMVLSLAYKIIQDVGVVESLSKLKKLIRKDFPDKLYAVSLKRLRKLIIKSGFIDVKIAYLETKERKKILRCPVCDSKTKKIKNRTLFGQLITSGYKCTVCRYWTGIKYRKPRKYTFQIRHLPKRKL